MIERSLRALSALLLLVLSSGCSDLRNCPNDNPDTVSVPITKDRIEDGKSLSDPVAITYQSAPDWNLDEFKAKTKYRFFHELGVTPLVVKIYLSFEQTGTGTDPEHNDKNESKPGSIAESAGNQALINCKDAHVIEIHNDTCEDFFVSVVATDAVPTKDGTPDTTKYCGE
jgi:hypothetical protein